VRLSGDAIEETTERGEPIVDETLLVLLNAQDSAVPFTLPTTPADTRWVTVLDTAHVQREPRKLHGGEHYQLESRSLAVLRQGRVRALQSHRP
jgi:glycogen operon protein